MLFLVSIKIYNISTNAPIVGANVFIDGQNHTEVSSTVLTSDSNGLLVASLLNAGNRQVQITASGFQSSTSIVTVDSSVSLLAANLTSTSLNIGLTPTATASTSVILQFNPAIEGVNWALTDGITTKGSGVTNSLGNTSIVSVDNGTYIVTANFTGYIDVSTSITANGQTDPFIIPIIAIADGNTASTIPTISIPSAIVSSVTSTPPSNSEFIYPNSEYDKYFTTAAARIYIGNMFIDELVTLQSALQDNALPIYGYASRFADAYGQGRSLVQGQFTINFVTEGYLYTILNEYNKFISSKALSTPAGDTLTNIVGLVNSRNALGNAASNNRNFESDLGGTVQDSIDSFNSQIDTLTTGLSASQISTLNTMLNAPITPPNEYINAVYQDILFDIRIELGNKTTGVQRTRKIEACKLIANEQVYSQDGSVLMDSYSFLARRAR